MKESLEFDINGERYFSNVEELENSIPYALIKGLCVLNGVPTENLKEHLLTIAKKNPVSE